MRGSLRLGVFRLFAAIGATLTLAYLISTISLSIFESRITTPPAESTPAPEPRAVTDAWAGPHPPRSATTTVIVSPAIRASVRSAYEAVPGLLEFLDYDKYVLVRIAHELLLTRDDPLLQAFRSGDAADDLRAFTERLGHFLKEDSIGPVVYSTPNVTTRSGENVTVTFTGDTYIGYRDRDPIIRLRLEPPTGAGSLPHPIDVVLSGWTIAAVDGPPPLEQTRRTLRARGDASTSVIIVRDGAPVSGVAEFLRTGGQSIAGTGPEDMEPVEPFLISATWLVLLVMVVRIQAKGWHRRPAELLMIAVATAAPVAILVVTPHNQNSPRQLGWIEALPLYLLPVGTVLYASLKINRPKWRNSRRGLLIVLGALLGWVLALSLGIIALNTQSLSSDLVRTLFVTLTWGVILVAAVMVAMKTWDWRPAAVAVAVLAAAWILYSANPDYVLDIWRLVGPPPAEIYTFIGITLPVVVVLLLVLRLRRIGRRAEATTSGTAYASAAVVLMILYLGPAENTIGAAALLAWAGLAYLLPRRAATAELAAISPDRYRALVKGALRRRFLRSAQLELFRTGRSRVAGAELTVAAFDRQRRSLDRALEEQGGGIHPDLAFATSGGRSPWENGLVSFLVGLLLTLPIALIHQWPLGTGVFSVLYASRTLLTLPFLGFVFGYFYPRVRGTTPLGKALTLFVVALTIESSTYLLILGMNELSDQERLILLAIVLGQCGLFGLGLGLFWEWRLGALAGESWARIRSGRSAQAIAAPLVALLLAIGTTVATTLAGAAVSELLKPAQLPAAEPRSSPSLEGR